MALATTAAGAGSCASCGGKTCILEGSAGIAGGTTSVPLSLCNYDPANAPTITLSLGSRPSCDSGGVLLPQVKALAINTTNAALCTKSSADPCPVVATLQAPIDWAIALKTKNGVNTLLATLDKSDVVKIATFSSETTPVVTSAQDPITICAANIPVKGDRFSSVDACNVVQVCRGPAGATTCVVPEANSVLRNVTATTTGQAALLSMAAPLACDAVSINSLVYVQVKVGDAELGAMTQIATISALSSSTPISLVPPSTGTTKVVLRGDVCAGSNANFALSPNTTALPATTADGTTLTLPSPFMGSSTLNVSYTLCGATIFVASSSAAAAAVVTPVSKPESFPTTGALTNFFVAGSGFNVGNVTCAVVASKGAASVTLSGCTCLAPTTTNLSVSCSNSLTALEGYSLALQLSGASPVVFGSVSSGATTISNTGTPQEVSSAGLSGGWIAGICIVVVAAVGFIVECMYHKKRFIAESRARAPYLETNAAA
ncbi:hypothetical protein ACHHYP_08391 [Achlya hypogyna]|uniref:Uncharacterized protein n=1 Tax=Achlya hypogyna TaxID=1202772 RepID=A0A1V9ZKT3_ACHHY|nr:hypothetical protein ACHHYP_08391 [Achlya hypogyna]